VSPEVALESASTEPSSAWPPAFEKYVLPYARDALLWPVTFSVLAHGSVVLAPLFLHMARGFAPGSILAAALIGAGTIKVMSFEWKAIRRPGAVTALLTLTWLGGVGLAWLANKHGVY
jgi:hypothetical protein